jgi:uncharacterized protein YkwD
MIWIFLFLLLPAIYLLTRKKEVKVSEPILYDGDKLELLRLINEYRATFQLNPLNPELHLDNKAQQTAEKFPPVSHNHFSGIANEIVCGGYHSLKGILDAYKRSSEHNDILLLPNAKSIGIGLKKVDLKYYNSILIL